MENSEKKSEKILAEHIRRYKRATRKIKKLKKLYNDITDEFNYNYYKVEIQPLNSNSCCCCKREGRKRFLKCFKYYFYFLPFSWYF